MIRPAYLLIPLWLTLVTGLSLWIGSPTEVPPEQWKAARDFPRNHQLDDTDLVGPKERYLMARMIPRDDLVARHLVVEKSKGDPIAKVDVTMRPTLPAIERSLGLLFYSLKGEELLTAGMNVGSWVIACFVRDGEKTTEQTTTKCTTMPVEVEAVHRANSNTDSTWVALRVQQCQLQEIGEYMAREKRLLLLAANPPLPNSQSCERKTSL